MNFQLTLPKESWKTYWEEDLPWTYPELFYVNAEIFSRFAFKKLGLNSSHQLLNVGCGPGFLEQLLAPKVKSIDSLDVSQQMLVLLNQHTKNHSNVRGYPLQQPYTSLSFLSKKYDFFFLISTAQYYQSMEELKTLILEAMAISNPSGKLILADLPPPDEKSRFFTLAIQGFLQALLGGYVWQYLTCYFRRSARKAFYNQQAQITPHLTFTSKACEDLFQSMGLAYKRISQPLSICPGRLNYVIHLR